MGLKLTTPRSRVTCSSEGTSQAPPEPRSLLTVPVPATPHPVSPRPTVAFPKGTCGLRAKGMPFGQQLPGPPEQPFLALCPPSRMTEWLCLSPITSPPPLLPFAPHTRHPSPRSCPPGPQPGSAATPGVPRPLGRPPPSAWIMSRWHPLCLSAPPPGRDPICCPSLLHLQDPVKGLAWHGGAQGW